MDFFLSGEIDGTHPLDQIDNKFTKASSDISVKLSTFLEALNYGAEVEELNIIPIIVKQPKEMEDAGWFKERKLFKRKSRSTDFRLRIDYDDFCLGSDEKRIKLILRNIIDSIRILDCRATKDFDGKKLEADILNLYEYQYDNL